MKNILCKLGLHKYKVITFEFASITHCFCYKWFKQKDKKCLRCGKRILPDFLKKPKKYDLLDEDYFLIRPVYFNGDTKWKNHRKALKIWRFFRYYKT